MAILHITQNTIILPQSLKVPALLRNLNQSLLRDSRQLFAVNPVKFKKQITCSQHTVYNGAG